MKYFWFATARAGGLITTDDDGYVVGEHSCRYYARAYHGLHLNDVVKKERDAGRKVAWMELEPHP